MLFKKVLGKWIFLLHLWNFDFMIHETSIVKKDSFFKHLYGPISHGGFSTVTVLLWVWWFVILLDFTQEPSFKTNGQLTLNFRNFLPDVHTKSLQ